MSYAIVVARYNENIDWLRENEHVVLMNKGEPLHKAKEYLLENVGRESESYLQYILMNYDALPDIVVFTQANIADHRGKNDIQYLLSLREEAIKYGKSLPILQHFQSPYNCCWDPEFNVRRTMHCWWDHDQTQKEKTYFLQENYQHNTPVSFVDWFRTHIQKEYPNPIHIYYNAIFAVNKQYILQHPREYYEELRKTVAHHINSTEGHFFERSWFYIFS